MDASAPPGASYVTGHPSNKRTTWPKKFRRPIATKVPFTVISANPPQSSPALLFCAVRIQTSMNAVGPWKWTGKLCASRVPGFSVRSTVLASAASSGTSSGCDQSLHPCTNDTLSTVAGAFNQTRKSASSRRCCVKCVVALPSRSAAFDGSKRAWPWRDADVILDFDDGALLASVRHQHEGWTSVPLEHGDVTIDVDLSIRKEAADARYGVVCRAGEKGFYSIEIGSDGRAYAFKHPKSTFASRLGASPKGSGGTRSRLHLHVECIGDALRAFVDGVPTLEVHGATYPRGERVGVIAGKQGKSAEPAIAAFDDFVVRGG